MKTLQKALILLMAMTQIGFAQTPRQIKVIIDNANIRSRPELDSEILETAVKGTLLDFIEKAGPWYTIAMGTDPSGKAVYGYIHESMVEPVGAAAPELQPAQEPAALPPPPPRVEEPPLPGSGSPVKEAPPERLISGSYLKYGFGDYGFLSFGADLGIARNFGIGLEIQPSYRRNSDIDRTVVQIDVFANAKLGFKLAFMTLYGGGGIGPDFSFVDTEIGGHSSSEFRTMLATHGIVGLALTIGKIGILFEYQPILISDPDIDSDEWGHFFLVGLKF
jgi:Bacterial SH3 domain